jgi:hypothetical protein
MELEYKFNGNTHSEDIILGTCQYIVSRFENEGYKLIKRPNDEYDIIKKANDFRFTITIYYSSIWNDLDNIKEFGAHIHTINCSFYNKRLDEYYLDIHLEPLFPGHGWELSRKEYYENSLRDILQKIDTNFTMFTGRFMNDRIKLVFDIVNKGFCSYGNINFVARYGNKELLEELIQNYYNRYILQDNERHDKFKKNIIYFKCGKEIYGGVDNYAIRAIVKYDLNILLH